MEILVTGNIRWLKNDFWEVLAKQNQVVVCAPDTESIKGNIISTYQFEIGKIEFEQMFLTYNFDYVIDLSGSFEQDAYDEIRSLEKILAVCRKREQTKMIYICPSRQISVCYGEAHAIIENACDRICGLFCAEGGCLTRLSVPYLVSATQNNDIFNVFYQSMAESGRLDIGYRKEHIIDFLFGSDLAFFLSAVMEESEGGYRSYRLYGGNEMTAMEMAEIITKSSGRNDDDVSVSFGGAYRHYDLENEKDKQELRSKYGWFPKEKLENRVGDWYADYQKKTTPTRKKKAGLTVGEHRLYLAEIAVLFVVCEILTVMTRSMQLVDFADFRLFCVAIVGMMYGLRYGMIVAVATCIAYLAGFGGGASWQIQFYNIVNWLPFATYLLTGAIAGYTRDRYQDQIENLTKSQEIMEDKYIYLNQMYDKALENKEIYGRQIVNYKDSLGRVYAVTKKLDSMHVDEILRQAIGILEDMMETQRVAVYFMDGDSLARLRTCSEGLADTLPGSISLDDMPECRQALESSVTWVNRAFLEGQPDYAYGIYKDHVLWGMITLQKVQYRQMSLAYLNRFNIVSGLIGDALLRAADYEKTIGHDAAESVQPEQLVVKEKEA